MIDDDESVLSVQAEMLQWLGYTVVAKSSCNEALAALRSDPCAFELIITDQIMPEMTGLELTVEAHRLHPELPIILCSGTSGAGEGISEELVREKGARGLLAKPVSMRKMAETLDQLFRGSSDTE